MSARSRYLAAISPRESDSPITATTATTATTPSASLTPSSYAKSNNAFSPPAPSSSSNTLHGSGNHHGNLKSPSDIRGRRGGVGGSGVGGVGGFGGGAAAPPPPPPPPPPGPPPKKNKARHHPHARTGSNNSSGSQQQQQQSGMKTPTSEQKHLFENNNKGGGGTNTNNSSNPLSPSADAKGGSQWSPREEIQSGNVAKFQQMLWGGEESSPKPDTKKPSVVKSMANNFSKGSPSSNVASGGNGYNPLNSYQRSNSGSGTPSSSLPPATPPRHANSFRRGTTPTNLNIHTGSSNNDANSTTTSSQTMGPSPKYKRNAPPPLNREETPSLQLNSISTGGENNSSGNTPPQRKSLAPPSRVLSSPNRIGGRVTPNTTGGIIGGSGSIGGVGIGGARANLRSVSPSLRQRVGSNLSLTPLDTSFGNDSNRESPGSFRNSPGLRPTSGGNNGGVYVPTPKTPGSNTNRPAYGRSNTDATLKSNNLNNPSNNSSRGRTYGRSNSDEGISTLTAFKRPNAKVGIVFTRKSAREPEVAVISRILPESIFRRHRLPSSNRDGNSGGGVSGGSGGGEGIEGAEVIAVNGTPVRDPRHAAELVARAAEEVRLTVKRTIMEDSTTAGGGGNQEDGGVESEDALLSTANNDLNTPYNLNNVNDERKGNSDNNKSLLPQAQFLTKRQNTDKSQEGVELDQYAVPHSRSMGEESALSARTENSENDMGSAGGDGGTGGGDNAIEEEEEEDSIHTEEGELSAATEREEEVDELELEAERAAQRVMEAPPTPFEESDSDDEMIETVALEDKMIETVAPSVAMTNASKSSHATRGTGVTTRTYTSTITPKSAEIAERRRKVAQAMLLSEELVEDPMERIEEGEWHAADEEDEMEGMQEELPDPIELQRSSEEESEAFSDAFGARSAASGSAVSAARSAVSLARSAAASGAGAISVAAASGVSAVSGAASAVSSTSAADRRRQAALEMYHSSEMVADNVDDVRLGTIDAVGSSPSSPGTKNVDYSNLLVSSAKKKEEVGKAMEHSLNTAAALMKPQELEDVGRVASFGSAASKNSRARTDITTSTVATAQIRGGGKKKGRSPPGAFGGRLSPTSEREFFGDVKAASALVARTSPSNSASPTNNTNTIPSPAAQRRLERAAQRRAKSGGGGALSPVQKGGTPPKDPATSPQSLPKSNIAPSVSAAPSPAARTATSKPPTIQRARTEESAVSAVSSAVASSGAGSSRASSEISTETPRSTRFKQFGKKKKAGRGSVGGGGGTTPRGGSDKKSFGRSGGTPPKGYQSPETSTSGRKKSSIFGVAKLIRKAGSKKKSSKKGIALNDSHLFDDPVPSVDEAVEEASPGKPFEEEIVPREATPSVAVAAAAAPPTSSHQPQQLGPDAPPPPPPPGKPPPLMSAPMPQDQKAAASPTITKKEQDPFSNSAMVDDDGWANSDFFESDPFASSPFGDGGGDDGFGFPTDPTSSEGFPELPPTTRASGKATANDVERIDTDAFFDMAVGADSWGEPSAMLPVDFTPKKTSAVHHVFKDGPDNSDAMSYDASEMSEVTNPTFASSVVPNLNTSANSNADAVHTSSNTANAGNESRPDPEEEETNPTKDIDKSGAPAQQERKASQGSASSDGPEADRRTPTTDVTLESASAAQSAADSGKENQSREGRQRSGGAGITSGTKKLPPSWTPPRSVIKQRQRERRERAAAANNNEDADVDPPLASLDTMESSEDERDDHDQSRGSRGSARKDISINAGDGSQNTEPRIVAKSRILSKYANSRARRSQSSNVSLGSIHDSPARDGKSKTKDRSIVSSSRSIESAGTAGSRGGRRQQFNASPVSTESTARSRQSVPASAEPTPVRKGGGTGMGASPARAGRGANVAKTPPRTAQQQQAINPATTSSIARRRRMSPTRDRPNSTAGNVSPTRSLESRGSLKSSPQRAKYGSGTIRKKKVSPSVVDNPAYYSMESRLGQIKDPIQRAGVRLLWAAAIPIQTQARRFLARQVAIKRMCAVLTIQAFVRRWLAERDLEIAIWSAIQIQASFRGWFARDSLEDNHYCATQIQRVVRGYLATMHVFEDLYSITIVQSVVRMHLAINDAVDRLSSIIAIQSWWRGIKTRELVEEMDYGAVAIQANWRRYLAQMSYQFDIIDIIIVQSVVRRWRTRRIIAAIRLQCFARSIKAMSLYREKKAMHTLLVRHISATKIQARWRSHSAQMRLLHYIAATRIQARWRSHTAQMQLLEYIAATRIQARWRAHVCEEQYLDYIAARMIQAQWRRHVCEEQYQQYMAATKIQARWRSHVCEEQYHQYMAATKIQARWRAHACEEQYYLERSAVKIQSCWRSYTAQVHMLISIVNVIVIQSLWRRRVAVKLYKPLLHRIKLAKERKRQNAAVTIQSTWRGFVLFSTYLIKRYENKAATTIQAYWRGYCQATNFSILYCAAIKVQALIRGRQERSWQAFQNECATIIQASCRRFLARRECHNECMVSILIAAAANSLRVRNAATRLQFWWSSELWKKKEKHAALVIERFFVYVKKEVEKEVKALKKKKKERRRRRKMKQSDDYILERAWLGVADDAVPAVPAAVPAQRTAPRYAPADNGVAKKVYNRPDRYGSRGVIQSVEEDMQSDVSGLTDLDFGYKNATRSLRSKKLSKKFEEDASLEEAFRESEVSLAKERLRSDKGQKSKSRREQPRGKGYPRRYDS